MTQNRTPKAFEVPLKRSYEFLYENFVIATQHDLYLLLGKSGDKVSGIRFCSSVFKYGYPNDEVPHPLYQYGLGFYDLYTIENSKWIEEIRSLNSNHPSDAPYLHEGKKHYIVSFKDVTLEVIAREIEEFEISTSELSQIISQELYDVRN